MPNAKKKPTQQAQNKQKKVEGATPQQPTTTQQPKPVQKEKKKVESNPNKHAYQVNKDKLAELKKGQSAVRTGGKGTVRRKKLVIRKTSTQDDQKLDQTLKKLNVRPLPDIEEVNFFMEDKTVIRFVKPTVKHSMTANTIIVRGAHEQKPLKDVIQFVYDQLGPDQLGDLKDFAKMFGQAKSDGKLGDDLAGLENIQIPNDEEEKKPDDGKKKKKKKNKKKKKKTEEVKKEDTKPEEKKPEEKKPEEKKPEEKAEVKAEEKK